METGYILNLSLVRSKISWSQFASQHSATVPVLNNTFPGDIFYDQFTLAPAPTLGQGSGGYSQVCQGELCCLFSINSTSTATSTPTLGVFRGLHTQFGEPVTYICKCSYLYMQVHLKKSLQAIISWRSVLLQDSI